MQEADGVSFVDEASTACRGGGRGFGVFSRCIVLRVVDLSDGGACVHDAHIYIYHSYTYDIGGEREKERKSEGAKERRSERARGERKSGGAKERKSERRAKEESISDAKRGRNNNTLETVLYVLGAYR